MSDPKHMEELRMFLQSKELLDERLPILVTEATKTVVSRGHFGNMPSYVEESLSLLASRNTRLIFEHAESPIEKMWMNSLQVQFLRSAEVLVVTPPVSDFPAHFKTIHRTIKGAAAFFSRYLKEGGGIGVGAIESYLDQAVADGRLDPDERIGAYMYTMEYGLLPYRFAHHLTLQAGFPSTERDKKGMRVDGLIWHPMNPALRVVVEQDGHSYHSDTNAFTRDRQRDRKLQAQGFSVYRFSGSEIHANPAKAVFELFEHLMKINDERPADEEEEEVATGASDSTVR